MTSEMDGKDLAERVKLIENMMAAGRCSTESWGWSFVLWGVAYYVATAWATWGQSNWAWPVTMVAAGVITTVMGARVSQGHPATTLGRAVGGVWTAVGTAMFVVLFSLAYSGHSNGHVSVAVAGALLGVANGASAIILKWKMQFVCAVVWLASTVIACFGSDDATQDAFLGAIFICQIVFGIYAMILESQRREQNGVAHA